jgi:hypothetical protein
MNRFLFLSVCFAFAFISGATAQTTHFVSKSNLERGRAYYAPRLETVMRSAVEQIPAAKQVRTPALPDPAGKTSSLSAIKLGSASNAFNWIRNYQNNLYLNDSLGVLVHIHRQDVTLHGGGTTASGKLRYDVSTDGGSTWSIDLGVINPIYTYRARYPQITGFAPIGSTSYSDLKWVWEAATLNAADEWDGIVSGVSEVVTTGTPFSTEHYGFLGEASYIPAGLCQGQHGEFWYADMENIANAPGDRVFLHKGIYNTGTDDVAWTRTDTLTAPWDLSFDAAAHNTIASIEFSPDGNEGWVTILGDMRGDTVYSPVYWHSSDGGDNWSSAASVDLSSFTWYKDSLQNLWVDSLGNPAGTGKATTAFDFDITVDMNGNLHIGTVIGNASATSSPEAGYSIFSDLAMFMTDIYTTDGGSTWNSIYLAPVLTLRGEFGGASGSDPLVMDNNPQAARNVDGSKVFFTWADTDTNTVGFGESANLAPNLRGVSWRVTDNYRTCYKLFTDGDLLWGDQIMFPAMAPQTLRSGSAEKMFTGFIAFQVPWDELQPTDFYTIVNDTWFDDSEYLNPFWFQEISWDGCWTLNQDKPVITKERAILYPSYPNPTDGEATIAFELSQSANAELVICNLYGQQVAVIARGEYAAGTHKMSVNTADLAPGIYFCTLRSGEEVITQKMMVTK